MNKTLGILIGLGLLLCGCGRAAAVNALSTTPEVEATPTVATAASLFGAPAAEPQSGTGTAFRPIFGEADAPVGEAPAVTATSQPTATAVPTVAPPEYVEVVIYDDKLNQDWSLEQSTDVDYALYDTAHWFSKIDEGVDSGAVSIAVTPLSDFGKLFFTVVPGTHVTYARKHVLGLSLWLNSGGNIIDTDDLVLSVVGSNERAYWQPDDHSVFAGSNDTFSETRLYYLGLNRAIPPDTWVRIVLWLDDLQFDPIYENVVGFHIKNDADFEGTFYIDNVSLLVAP